MAEWEELQALAITWRSYPEILTQIAFHAALEVKDASATPETIKNTAQSSLHLAGATWPISSSSLPINPVWIRDYGPNCVYANERGRPLFH
ncbi:MAG: hypothetical protein IPM82_25135 [Saprospiraceae bacterium]|nr:hypothetical protein [Saprospiraceae bacterium]